MGGLVTQRVVTMREGFSSHKVERPSGIDGKIRGMGICDRTKTRSGYAAFALAAAIGWTGGISAMSAFVTFGTTAVQAAESGLEFPSNRETGTDIRFKFSDANLQSMYPATYVWRVKLRRQAGYYTTHFWGTRRSFHGWVLERRPTVS